MLSVNLLTSHHCSRKKYKIQKVIGELTLFTLLVIFISLLIRLKYNLTYLNGSIIILLGFTYFFPLKHLYDESSDRTLAIMFFSWSHTLIVSFLSFQTSKLLGFNNSFNIVLAIQTVIFLFTTPLIIKFVKSEFFYILKNIPEEINRYLLLLSLSEFTLISVINLYFPKDINLGVIIVVLVAFTATLSYHLIYIIVKNFKNIKSLQRLAYSDTLTGIRNRLGLFLDCEEMISENKPFSLIYMDLDDFKKINDRYGHSVGDTYLKHFTEITIQTVGDKGNIYRMSGDEFVCIYKNYNLNLFMKTYEEKIKSIFGMNIPFLGVSIGCAKFPEDADSIDDLINIADKIMYKVKNETKKISRL